MMHTIYSVDLIVCVAALTIVLYIYKLCTSNSAVVFKVAIILV